MKKIFLLSFLLFSTNLFTQNLRLTDYTQNYYTLKSEAKVYLDSIHSLTPDSIFYHEGSEYSQFQQWQDFWEPRLFPHGDFNLYFNKLEESFRSNSTRSTYNANWLEIGPTDEPSGTMAANGGQSAGIGPIEFIKFYKSNPQNMLCGSIKGGLFYSNDGGENWTNAGSDIWQGTSSAVTWAEFKIDDPEVAYASSGYPTDNEPGSIGGWGGIYRTQKNGAINSNSQWDLVADYTSLGVTANCKIKKTHTDPSNPDILFVVTNEGLFKSTNINSTIPTWLPLLIDDVFDLEIYPGNSNILYASFSGVNSNIVKYSIDAGSNWLNLPSIPAYTSAQIRHISIEVSDAFPDNIYLYFYGFSSPNKDLFRYNYTPQTFSQINLPGPNIDDGSASCCFGYGTSFSVSQSGIDEVIFIADNDRYSRYYNGVQTRFTNAFINRFDYHVDIEGFAFNPTNANEIWMASHGGPYKSVYPSDIWEPKMKGVGVAQVTSIADSYTNPESVLMSLYHDGAVLTTSTYFDFWNPSWKYVAGEDSYRSLIDSKDPSYMYTYGSSSWQSSNGSSTTPFPTLGIYDYIPAAINKVETNFFYGRGGPGINNLEILRSATHGTNPVSKISNISGLVGIPNGCSHVAGIFTFENQKDLLVVAFAGDEQSSNSTSPCYNPIPNNTLRLYYTQKATDPLIDPINDWKFIDLENNGGRNNS